MAGAYFTINQTTASAWGVTTFSPVQVYTKSNFDNVLFILNQKNTNQYEVLLVSFLSQTINYLTSVQGVTLNTGLVGNYIYTILPTGNLITYAISSYTNI
jgi:hypothetical protein